jgi:hypothetical protein
VDFERLEKYEGEAYKRVEMQVEVEKKEWEVVEGVRVLLRGMGGVGILGRGSGVWRSLGGGVA